MYIAIYSHSKQQTYIPFFSLFMVTNQIRAQAGFGLIFSGPGRVRTYIFGSRPKVSPRLQFWCPSYSM